MYFGTNIETEYPTFRVSMFKISHFWVKKEKELKIQISILRVEMNLRTKFRSSMMTRKH